MANGKFEMMARACDQCLLTKNRIVSGRRAAQIVRDTVKKDTHFICHKGSIAGRDIACRGHFEATGSGQLVRIMGRLNAIVEIDPETMEPVTP